MTKTHKLGFVVGILGPLNWIDFTAQLSLFYQRIANSWYACYRDEVFKMIGMLFANLSDSNSCPNLFVRSPVVVALTNRRHRRRRCRRRSDECRNRA